MGIVITFPTKFTPSDAFSFSRSVCQARGLIESVQTVWAGYPGTDYATALSGALSLLSSIDLLRPDVVHSVTAGGSTYNMNLGFGYEKPSGGATYVENNLLILTGILTKITGDHSNVSVNSVYDSVAGHCPASVSSTGFSFPFTFPFAVIPILGSSQDASTFSGVAAFKSAIQCRNGITQFLGASYPVVHSGTNYIDSDSSYTVFSDYVGKGVYVLDPNNTAASPSIFNSVSGHPPANCFSSTGYLIQLTRR